LTGWTRSVRDLFFAFQALQHVPDGGVPFLVNAFRVEPN